jgi:hypothetical protein
MFVSIVLFCILFVCKCVPYYCHRVSTQLHFTNISYRISYIIYIIYRIISFIIYHIISYIIYYIIYRIVSYHIIYIISYQVKLFSLTVMLCEKINFLEIIRITKHHLLLYMVLLTLLHNVPDIWKNALTPCSEQTKNNSEKYNNQLIFTSI